MDPSPQLYLAGPLAELAGPRPRLAFATIRQAVGLLRANYPDILTLKDMPIHLRLDGYEVGAEAYDLPLRPGAQLELGPALAGAVRGEAKVALGALLVTASFFIPGSTPLFAAAGKAALNVGISVALGGVGQLLAADVQSPEPEQRGGGLYSGPRSASGEGAALPLLYGYARVGGVLIQRSLDTVRV